jgi:SAM-dependent methyltransferase
MNLRTKLCFELSRKLMKPAHVRTTDHRAYEQWRQNELGSHWREFDDSWISNRDVLDFGCGDGQLSLLLADQKRPRCVVGVDIDPDGLARAREAAKNASVPPGGDIEFIQGTPTSIPVPDQSFDTILAFDCMEHIMSPSAVLREWGRVLRPAGRCLIEWVPYKGPWGPHMESLIPLPWAHVLFGERAMFRTAEMIYDLPEFEPRHWDLDANGNKKPNKWRRWSSFSEQGFINQLDIGTLGKIAAESQLKVVRLESRGFGRSSILRLIGQGLMAIPYVGEYFVSSYILELERTNET